MRPIRAAWSLPKSVLAPPWTAPRRAGAGRAPTPTWIGSPAPPPRLVMPTLELTDVDIVEVTPVRSLTLRRLETNLRDLGDGSAWARAHRGAAVLAKELRAQTVLVHMRSSCGASDAARARDELRTIGAAGKRAGDFLGASFWLKDDRFARNVIASTTPVRARFDGTAPAPVPARLATLAPSRSVVAAAIRVDGSAVGLVEAIDPDERFDAMVLSAVALLAERLEKGGLL